MWLVAIVVDQISPLWVSSTSLSVLHLGNFLRIIFPFLIVSRQPFSLLFSPSFFFFNVTNYISILISKISVLFFVLFQLCLVFPDSLMLFVQVYAFLDFLKYP